MTSFIIHADEIIAAFNRLQSKVQAPSPVLKSIGEHLLNSTDDRFAGQIGPDGQKWAPNTATTIQRYVQQKMQGKNPVKKDGTLSKKAATLFANKRILQGHTGMLRGQLYYRVTPNGVEIGSPSRYATTQQFGAKKGEFGKGAPWGDIPARPFLGLSKYDERAITDILQDYLEQF